jgi:iron complex transport system permease protein
MIGFDSVFMGTQTLLVFAFGSFTPLFTDPIINFFVTSGAMVAISMLMFGAILRKGKNNIIFLLMFGLVLSGIVSNGVRYLQALMNHYDFYQVQAATAVTVMNMNTVVINIAWPIIVVVAVLLMLRHRVYDVMSLGPEQAMGLGISYQREMTYALLLISIGMSVATAMIGSLTFLGLLVVNASREIIKTYRHLPLFICSVGVAIVTLVLGSAIEQLLQGLLPLTTIINLVGCTYVFYLILKENRL